MLEKLIRWIIAFVLALLGIEFHPRPEDNRAYAAVPALVEQADIGAPAPSPDQAA